MRYCAFTLHAPLAAFGAVAVGERRPSWNRPGRSAVFGLLAAALGIQRDQGQALDALDRGYGMALRTDAPGTLLSDYHTTQMPPQKRGRARLPTRAAELREDLETVLTRREYRAGAVHVVALWARPEAARALDELQDALRRPAFVLYAGRKSCPLGLPLDPQLVEAASPPEAIAARAAACKAPEHALRAALQAGVGVVTMDAADARDFGLDVARVEMRRDALASRARWQFALREEAVLRSPALSAASGG